MPKISELPAATAAAPTDQLEVNQAGASKRVTVTQLLDVVHGGGPFLPLTGGTLTGSLQVGAPPGSGSVGLASGGPTHPGYIQWVRPDNTRLGYIGFNDGALSYNADAGFSHEFSTGNVVMGGNLAVGGPLTSGSINAPVYQMGGINVLTQGVPGFTTLCNPVNGLAGLYVGGPPDQSNFHRNGSHYFQNIDGSLAYLTLNNTVAYFYVPINAPTADPASNDERVATTRFVRRAVEAALTEILQRLDDLERDD